MNFLTHTNAKMDILGGHTYFFLLQERYVKNAIDPDIRLTVEKYGRITYIDPMCNLRVQEDTDTDLFDYTDALSVVRSIAAFHTDFLKYFNITVDPASLLQVGFLPLPEDVLL